MKNTQKKWISNIPRVIKNLVNYSVVLLLLISLQSYGSNASIKTIQNPIKGIVKDVFGAPLAGVNVKKLGTKIGVSSDLNGKYSINAKKGDLLSFSYLGMKPQTILVGDTEIINIILEEDNNVLDEVVLVGYGSSKRKDVTGAITSIKPNVNEAATTDSFDRVLQGKVAGVTVSSTLSTPGAAISISIRGANSLRGDNQPLYVVDGVAQPSTANVAGSPFGGGDVQTAQNPLISINPQDIESIDVLKDASATAIYGSRGANGVILITTKKGKSGGIKLNYNYNTTLSSVTNQPEMLGLDDFATFSNSITPNVADHRFIQVGNDIRFAREDGYDANDATTYAVIEEENWFKQAYRTAFSQNHFLNASGGKKGVNYYISAGYKNIEGTIQNANLTQGNLRANINADLTDKLSVVLTLDGAISENSMAQGTDSRSGTASGSLVRTAISSAPFQMPTFETNVNEDVATTIGGWIDDYDDINKISTYSGALRLKYKISKVFTFEVGLGGRHNNSRRARWFGTQLFRGLQDNGSLGINDFTRKNYSVENLLRFRKKINSFLRIDGLVGVTYDKFSLLNNSYAGTQFDVKTLRTNGAHLANNIVLRPSQRDYQIGSYLSRLNLNMANGKYIATFSLRADGSSRFKNDKWGYFPSVAGLWKIHEENLLKESSVISELKLRAGFGLVGSQGVAPYSTISDFSVGTNVSYADIDGNSLLAAGASRLANPNLKWETTSSYNIGLDFSLFEKSLYGEINVYEKITSDLLLNKTIPTSNGFGVLAVNQGEIKNSGIELSLGGDIVKTEDWTFGMSGNISFNKSKILDLGLEKAQFGNHELAQFMGPGILSGTFASGLNIFAEGYEPGLFWGFKTDGIIQDLQDITYIDEQGNEVVTEYRIIDGGNNPQPGDIKFVDLNNDGVVDQDDRTFLGNPNPDFVYGFNINVAYKAVSLVANFNGRHGGDIFNANRRIEFTSSGNRNIRKEAFDNIWTPENKSNLYPRRGVAQTREVTDRLIESGDFLRLANLTATFKMPKKVLDNLSLSAGSIFLTGSNLLLITDYDGYDPEVNSFAFQSLRNGIDLNSFPNNKSFTIGVNLTF